jgi:hypothetical protein
MQPPDTDDPIRLVAAIHDHVDGRRPAAAWDLAIQLLWPAGRMMLGNNASGGVRPAALSARIVGGRRPDETGAYGRGATAKP